MSSPNKEVRTDKIHSTNYSKLGKRGLMKKLAGVGFSAASVSLLTTEDIKAASSDQVPIVIGQRRENPEDPFSKRVPQVKNVPADWYNSLQKARRVKRNAENRYISNSAIAGIGISPGEKPNQSKILIQVYEDRRGSITLPHEIGGVPTKIRSVGEWKAGSCDISELNNWDASSETCYGGYYIYNEDGGDSGTFATEVYDGSDEWGLSAHHVLENQGDRIEDPNDFRIGVTSDEKHCKEDWALFAEDSDVDFTDDIRFNNFSGVTGSFSQDGCSDLCSYEAYCHKVGHTTCNTGFNITDCNTTTYDINTRCTKNYHQNVYSASNSDFEPGDSGSLVYYTSPNNSSYCWAVGLANYEDEFYNNISGVGSWKIKERGYNF